MEINLQEAKDWVNNFLNATETVTRGAIRAGISLSAESEAKLQKFEAFIKEEEAKFPLKTVEASTMTASEAAKEAEVVKE